MGIDILASGNVRCIQKCGNALDNTVRDISYDRREKNLHLSRVKSDLYIRHRVKRAHLHQCFRVVPCPLLEAATMGKSVEAWKQGYCCNTISGLASCGIAGITYRLSISSRMIPA
jgi:hypothetical protein